LSISRLGSFKIDFDYFGLFFAIFINFFQETGMLAKSSENV
jgi:hypothetical protein